MAHNKSSRYTKNTQFRRDDNYITNRRLPITNYVKNNKLREIEDRRVFHPEYQQRPARNFKGLSHTLKIKNIPILRASRPEGYRWNPSEQSYQPLPYRIGFEDPKRILVCVRRKIRREVMNAIINSKGGVGSNRVRNFINKFRKPKYSQYSSIGC